jgi:hypothetical protein
MPSFEQLILSAPMGFVDACLALNSLAETKEATLQTIVQEAWNEATKKQNATNSETKSYNNERKGLLFIVRSMRTAQPPPSLSVAANVLVSSTCLFQSTVEKTLLLIKELSKSADSADMDSVKVCLYLLLIGDD